MSLLEKFHTHPQTPPLHCLTCSHVKVCNLLAYEGCQNYQQARTVEDVQHGYDRKAYRLEMMKAKKVIFSIMTMLDTAALSLEKQGETLRHNAYDPERLLRVAHYLRGLNHSLKEETEQIDQKSKFPPQ